MAAPLAMDLRTRVMRDLKGGMTVVDAATKYSVSARTIYHWKTLVRDQGSPEPRRGRPGRKPKLSNFREQILAVVRENPEITLEDLQQTLRLPVCLSTVWLALKGWGIVLKKSSPRGRTAAT
ncbi:MAG: transposase [Schlesneria sp.]|nr:transposase [Schlesneria sp.]